MASQTNGSPYETSSLATLLGSMDLELIGTTDIRRPWSSTQTLHNEHDISPTSRLMYRPEPGVPDGPDGPTGVLRDLSFHLFYDIAMRSHLFDDEIKENLEDLHDLLHRDQVNWLTNIDLAACQPPTKWWGTEVFMFSVGVLKELSEAFDSRQSNYFSTSATYFNQRLENCETYMIAHRLTFYNGRLKSKSMADIMTDLDDVQRALGIPESWNVKDEILELQRMIEHDLSQISADFGENAKLEWVGPLIPMLNFSRQLSDANTAECSICCGSVTQPGVQTTCNHTFCSTCLAAWAYACQPNSHTCPICRSKLFEKPEYEIDPQAVRDREMRFAEYRDAQKRVQNCAASWAWFNEEKNLQWAYEAEK